MLAVLQDDVSHFPDALPMALAAQSYAKSELLWYFRHVGDKLPPSPAIQGASKITGQLLGQQAKQPQLADDMQAVSLVAAAAALYDLLVSAGAAAAGGASRHELSWMPAEHLGTLQCASRVWPSRNMPSSGLL
jgi:hypothetical protein